MTLARIKLIELIKSSLYVLQSIRILSLKLWTAAKYRTNGQNYEGVRQQEWLDNTPGNIC